MTTTIVRQLSQHDFKSDVVESDRPVLVDFWATWCQPCLMLAPIVEQLAEQYADRITVAKVDTDANPDLSLEYEINSIPSVLLFKDGEVVQRFIGVRTLSEYTAALDAVLS